VALAALVRLHSPLSFLRYWTNELGIPWLAPQPNVGVQMTSKGGEMLLEARLPQPVC
jgi:hypothetical protein